MRGWYSSRCGCWCCSRLLSRTVGRSIWRRSLGRWQSCRWWCRIGWRCQSRTVGRSCSRRWRRVESRSLSWCWSDWYCCWPIRGTTNQLSVWMRFTTSTRAIIVYENGSVCVEPQETTTRGEVFGWKTVQPVGKIQITSNQMCCSKTLIFKYWFHIAWTHHSITPFQEEITRDWWCRGGHWWQYWSLSRSFGWLHCRSFCWLIRRITNQLSVWMR